MHWDMHMQNTCTVILLRYSSISNWDLQTRGGKERECAFYISSVCHAFGSRSPARLLPRCEDPSRHHRRVPPPPCLVLLLPPHLLLPLRGDGAPLEYSGSSSAWMPRWSSAGRVTHASVGSTVSGSVQAFLAAIGPAASTRLGVATRRPRSPCWASRCRHSPWWSPCAERGGGAAASPRWRRSSSACYSHRPLRPPSRFGRATGG
jgi:hypothetical protein